MRPHTLILSLLAGSFVLAAVPARADWNRADWNDGHHRQVQQHRRHEQMEQQRHRQWAEQQRRRERAWREHEWRERHRYYGSQAYGVSPWVYQFGFAP